MRQRLGLDLPGAGNVRTFVRRGREFDEPIALPDGTKLVCCATRHITALPKKESAAPAWQAAIEALMLVVELGGPTVFAASA